MLDEQEHTCSLYSSIIMFFHMLSQEFTNSSKPKNFIYGFSSGCFTKLIPLKQPPFLGCKNNFNIIPYRFFKNKRLTGREEGVSDTKKNNKKILHKET